ncbi:MAG: hypothetical protein LH605_02840 [Microbacteriaceae bacterium]|nr:hypothetical protein [Microbacteriaceae bacterium]
MLAVVVIAVAVTVLALSALVGTEIVLSALGRTSFISEFVGSPSANPGYIYDLILIAIAVLAASLGTAFLLVSAVVGVRLERRQGIALGTDADAADGRAGLGASGSGATFDAAAGPLGAAVASRFAPPASADPAPLFTPSVALETAVREPTDSPPRGDHPTGIPQQNH